MFNIVCVTHRKLCENFFKRVGELYENNVPVILREKDLSESEYEELAKKVIEICPNVILHSYINVAKKNRRKENTFAFAFDERKCRERI